MQDVPQAMVEMGFMVMQELVEKAEFKILQTVDVVVLEVEAVLEIHLEHRLNLLHLHLEIHFHLMAE